eukprot:6457925-Amphidinium_carterae.1
MIELNFPFLHTRHGTARKASLITMSHYLFCLQTLILVLWLSFTLFQSTPGNYIKESSIKKSNT